MSQLKSNCLKPGTRKTPIRRFIWRILCLGTWAIALMAHGSSPAIAATSPTESTLSLVQTQYRGWDNAWILSNPRVEAIVVPAIGRIMQFRFRETAGSFWENPALDGRSPRPQSDRWLNFGGDKIWPAPQSDWETIIGRSWPPPLTYDAMPYRVRVKGNALELISAVDSNYGIRLDRQIELDPNRPIMTVTSTYHKETGEPQTVAVWTVAQLQDPVAVYALIPQPSSFPEGYVEFFGDGSNLIQVENSLLSLTRDPQNSYKIGTEANTLIWRGTEEAIVMNAPKSANATYPDGGSSAEIYANADPNAYVELEFLSPLKRLARGDRLQLRVTYTLMKVTHN